MPKPSLTIRQYLLGAVLSLIVALLLLGLMLFHAETLMRLGLIGNLWYLMLLAMGLAVAVFLFLGFKSYSTYTGKMLDGTLEHFSFSWTHIGSWRSSCGIPGAGWFQ